MSASPQLLRTLPAQHTLRGAGKPTVVTRRRCLPHVHKECILILRPSYVRICDGDHCGALLLAAFEYWTDHMKSRRPIWKTRGQLQTELFGMYGVRTIGESLNALIQKGYLLSYASPRPTDRTRHFELNTSKISAALTEYAVDRGLQLDNEAGADQEAGDVDPEEAEPLRPRVQFCTLEAAKTHASEITSQETTRSSTVRRPPSAAAECRQPPDERSQKLASARALCSEDEAATLTKLLNEAVDKARQKGLPFSACGPVPNTQTSINILNEVRRRNPDATPEEIHAYLVRRVFLDEPTPARSWNKWEVVVKAIGRDYPAAVPRSGSRVLEPAADASKVEELRDHLLRCAEALRSRPELVEVCHALDGLAADANTQYRDLEGLEGKLTALEGQAAAVIRASVTEDDLSAMRGELDATLRPYRGRMKTEQIALLERQYLDRLVQEKAGLPRLSLFYPVNRQMETSGPKALHIAVRTSRE